MGLINNGKIVAGASPSVGFKYPFQIDYACKFEAANTDFLYRTNAATPIVTDGKKVTARCRVKKLGQGAYQALIAAYYDSNNYSWLYFDNDDTLKYVAYTSSTTRAAVDTVSVFRDPTQWYDIHLEVDSTLATEADRVKIYVNGVRQSVTGTLPSLNNALLSLSWQTFSPRVGSFTTSNPLDGYIADVHVFDGTVVPVTEFGEFQYNTWVPKEFEGGYSYGNTGYALDFADSENLGNDVSGNDRHLSSTNGSPVQTIDTPTNNFPTLDPLVKPQSAGFSLSKAGLVLNSTSGADWGSAYATVPIPSTGKWQMEFTINAASYGLFGVLPVSEIDSSNFIGYSTNGHAYAGNGSYMHDSSESVGEGAAYTAGDILAIVFDANAGSATFYKDGVLQFTVTGLDTSEHWVFGVSCYSSAYTPTASFGAEGFEYPIEGARPICTAYWPASDIPIVDSDEGLWIHNEQGNGATKVITGSPFQVAGSDVMIWLKCRDQAHHHKCIDTIRGVDSTYNELRPNTNDAGFNNDTGVTAFSANGYTLGANATYNQNLQDFIHWVFNMRAFYGMKIVAYTGNGIAGRTVEHNLNGIPELIITKRISNVQDWAVYHKNLDASAPEDKYLVLNTTAVVADSSALWNDTAPNSSVVTLGSGFLTNGNGESYISYLFRSISGFLKVGYYIGNGNADGPRIYTGFRPRYLIIKSVNSAYNWNVMDIERTAYNQISTCLFANDVNVDYTNANINQDFLSNGFKLRTTYAGLNTNSGRYIYLAIGDPFPFVNAF